MNKPTNRQRNIARWIGIALGFAVIFAFGWAYSHFGPFLH